MQPPTGRGATPQRTCRGLQAQPPRQPQATGGAATRAAAAEGSAPHEGRGQPRSCGCHAQGRQPSEL
eukprot:7813453-Alexandrium_andersonii.AAC.1